MTESTQHNSNNSRSRQLVGSIIAIVTTILLVAVLFLTQKGPEAKLEELPPLKVVLVEVKQQDLIPHESLTGRLQPIKTAQLKFEVQGRVMQRLVEPGMSVDDGQALLILDDNDLQDQFTQAVSQFQIEQAGVQRDQRMLKLAKDNLALQQSEVRRFEKLNDDSLISASQLDAARQQMLTLDSQVSDLQYKVKTAKARLALKKSDRDVAERNLKRATLKAPFAGFVNEVNVQVGDFVTATEIVASVVDTSSLDLQLDVRGEVAAALFLNQDINVHAGSHSIVGKLIALQPDPDISTNTHELRIRMPGDNIQSGMLASADLPLIKQQNAITVPVSSVATNAGESNVFTYQDGKLKRLPVIIRQRVGSEYIISSGPQSGEMIVARDVAGLADGQQVVADL